MNKVRRFFSASTVTDMVIATFAIGLAIWFSIEETERDKEAAARDAKLIAHEQEWMKADSLWYVLDQEQDKRQRDMLQRIIDNLDSLRTRPCYVCDEDYTSKE